MKVFLAIVCLVLTSGCTSSKYMVSYETSPSKAMVSCGDQDMGYTPLKLYYDREMALQTPVGTDCKATWISGATKYFQSLTAITVKTYPQGAVATLRRSPDDSGYETDARAALQAQTNAPRFNYVNDNTYVPNKTTYCNKVGGQVMCNQF